MARCVCKAIKLQVGAYELELTNEIIGDDGAGVLATFPVTNRTLRVLKLVHACCAPSCCATYWISQPASPVRLFYVCSLVVNGLAAQRLARAGEREARRAGAEKEIAVAACSGLFRSPAPLLILSDRESPQLFSCIATSSLSSSYLQSARSRHTIVRPLD